MEPVHISELVFLLLVSPLVNLSSLLEANTFGGTRKEEILL